MPTIAVFARNHLPYLEEACAIAAKEPSRPIALRSQKPWTAAKKALDTQERLHLYLAPIGSHGSVQYRATINAIKLYPKKNDPESRALLALSMPGTIEEGLWGEKVKTLFLISHCRKLSTPFSMGRLRKARDGSALSEDFGYSYSVILEPPDSEDLEVHPEEIAEPAEYIEGAVRRVTVNAFERSPAAREACVKHYGVNCAVCGFNFAAKYGTFASGFIHVHHLRPLSSIKKGYKVDPIADLRPVCPNCHAMIHHPDGPGTLEDLASLIKREG